MYNEHYNRIKLIFKNVKLIIALQYHLSSDTLIFKLWIKILLNFVK